MVSDAMQGVLRHELDFQLWRGQMAGTLQYHVGMAQSAPMCIHTGEQNYREGHICFDMLFPAQPRIANNMVSDAV